MKKLLVFGLFVLLLMPRAATAAPPRDDITDLDAFITKALQDYQVPGAAVAVVKDGKVVLLKGYGVRDINKPDEVDENTIFQIASITKTFTAAAAATVVDEKKLDWDTPIFNYLPEFEGYDPYMTRYMTERDLLAMRTGWPAFGGDPLDDLGYDRAEILRRLRYLIPAYSFREVSQYSNSGYFVAGEVAARVAGMSWNDLVANRIFAPLKMTRSGTSVEDLKDSNATATHAIVDGKVVLVEPSNQDTMGAAGSVTSTASDLVKYMLMYLTKGTFEGTQVLTPESVAEMFKRSMVGERTFTELPPISDTTGFYYGLGFDSYDYAGHHIIAKPGALAGVRTIIVMVPDLNAGIIVLSNLNISPFPEAVRAYFLNQLLGIDVNTDQAEILKINEQLSHLLDAPTPPANPGKFPWPLQSLVGVYENELYGRCEISLEGEAIKAACGPANYPASLTHWENGLFLWKFPDATRGYAQVIFSIGADGTADSFTHSGLGPFTRVEE